MAFCTECGHQLADGAKFCFECGAKVNGASSSHVEQRKIVYDGEIHKCPNCGEILNSFITNCPVCGYELRSVNTNSTVKELASKVEQASSLDEKIELITNFYVPNTREDIFDFFILAVSNLEDDRYDTDDAWRAKLEQTYHKARMVFGNTPEFEYIEKQYKKTRANVSRKWIQSFIAKNKLICKTVLLAVIEITAFTIAIVLFCSYGLDSGGAFGGWVLLIFCGMLGLYFFVIAAEFEEEEKKKKKAQRKQSGNTRVVGKGYEDFAFNDYEDAVEYLRNQGFQNIVTKAVKKGRHDTEDAVQGISIAGNPEFDENDVFDVNSKIIIRYYSKNVEG